MMLVRLRYLGDVGRRHHDGLLNGRPVLAARIAAILAPIPVLGNEDDLPGIALRTVT